MAQIALAAPVQLAARLDIRPRNPHPADRATGTSRARGMSGAPAGRIRLTRRGRIVLIGVPALLLAAVLLVAMGIFTAPATATEGAIHPMNATTVTVLDGDSLWGIAAEMVPHRDPREVVGEIVELNNLATQSLFPGQELQVPLGS